MVSVRLRQRYSNATYVSLSRSITCLVIFSRSSVISCCTASHPLRTGMRHGELAGLQWSSVDWQNKRIIVRHSRCPRTGELRSPKSNRERHIPLDVDVYKMLFKRKRSTGDVFLHTDGIPFPAHRLIRQLREVRYSAGLRPLRWHTLRHTFASHLAMNGVPLNIV